MQSVRKATQFRCFSSVRTLLDHGGLQVRFEQLRKMTPRHHLEASRPALTNCLKETVRKMTPEPSRHHLEASRPALSNCVKETAKKLTPEPSRHHLEASRCLLPPDKVLENCPVIQISARAREKDTFQTLGFWHRPRAGGPVFLNC